MVGTDTGQAPGRVDEELFAELPEACPDCGGELEESEEGGEQYQLGAVPRGAARDPGGSDQGEWEVGTLPELRASSARSPSATDLGGGRGGGGAGGTASAGLRVQPAQGAGAVGAKDGGDDARAGHQGEPGGLVQAMARIGDRCRPTYKALVEAVRQSPVVCGDETSWHVNGDGAWLWIMTTEQVTVYGIREGRGYEEAASLLGADYRGVLVRDGWVVELPGPTRSCCSALKEHA